MHAPTGRARPIDSPAATSNVDPRRARDWLWLLVLLVLTAVATESAVRLTRFGGGVSSIWVANGLLTGALLLSPRETWWRWLVAGALGQLLGRVASGDDWLMTMGLVMANLLECTVVAFWVRRGDENLRQARSLGKVSRDALLSTLAACALSATAAMPFLLMRITTSLPETWLTWYSAHVVGMVIIATFAVCAFQPHVHLLGEKGRRLDYFACLGLSLLVSWGVFAQREFPLLFLPFLPLLLLAYRHGLSGMLSGVLALAFVSGIAAADDAGPFAFQHASAPIERVLFWQFYLASACVLAFSTAVALTQRRQLERRIQRSEARVLAIAENLPAMVSQFDHNIRYVYANSRTRSMIPGADLVGRWLPDVRGPEGWEDIRPHVEGVMRGEPQKFDTWIMDGEKRVELRVQFVPDRASDGSVQGFYSLSADITEQKRLENELEHMARVDALTGLANRRQFDEALAQAVGRAKRTGAALMVLSLDLDRFKHINDTLGHAAGDEVLREFGQRVGASVYNVDLVARLGGDEFVVLVEYSANAEAGERMAKYILKAMQPPIVLSDGNNVQAATSIGIGLHHPVTSGAELMELADKALYEAKARGRNTWAISRG